MLREGGMRKGFTLIELLVVVGIMAILMGILLPAAEHVRHQAYITQCASNLRQIGQAELMYANDNQGNFPRTIYVADAPITQGTGITATNPFQPGGPTANDVTAAVWLLMRSEHLPTMLMICPYDDVMTYIPDSANPQNQSNFSNWQLNLGYSFADPYPSSSAANAGYRLTNHLPAQFALAADRNPGVHPPNSDATGATSSSSERQIENANSTNHEKDGQNVLFADWHVDFLHDPFDGIGQDNIYTNQANQVNASPLNAGDSVLLPTN
jgi:prepilin-type N-terminal cleavage/methylation domain-containing protein/prepilin-type processing-associated H-X9-DG protein